MKARLVRVLLALPFLLFFLAALEIFVRFFLYDVAYRDTRCNRNFMPKTDRELRRLFWPGCAEEVATPDGRTAQITTNEHGFRDRPAAVFSAGAIAVLGDSHVEGFAVSNEQTFSRALDASGRFPLPLLNIGYRGTGLEEQLRILAYARQHYKLRGLIWVLTENDILDDLYLRTREPGYWATRLNIFFLLASESLGRRWLTLEYLRVAMNGFALKHAVEKGGAVPMDKHLCASVAKAGELLGREVPISVVVIPHGAVGANLPYFGLQPDRKAFGAALECVRHLPLPVIDLSAPYSALQARFLPDHYHLDPEGLRLLAAAAAPQLAPVFAR